MSYQINIDDDFAVVPANESHIPSIVIRPLERRVDTHYAIGGVGIPADVYNGQAILIPVKKNAHAPDVRALVNKVNDVGILDNLNLEDLENGGESLPHLQRDLMETVRVEVTPVEMLDYSLEAMESLEILEEFLAYMEEGLTPMQAVRAHLEDNYADFLVLCEEDSEGVVTWLRSVAQELIEDIELYAYDGDEREELTDLANRVLDSL